MPHGESIESDEVLLAQVRQGSVEAFGELFRRYHAKVLKSVTTFARSHVKAEDATAEAFLRVFVLLQRVEPGPPDITDFPAYVFTVAKNLVRSAARENQLTNLADDADEFFTTLTVDDSTEQVHIRQLVSEVFSELPIRWRNALWYASVLGYSPEEMGAELGIKPTAASQLTYRAREGFRVAYLRHHLRDTAPEHKKFANNIPEYVRGSAGPRARRQLEAHLSQCVDCTEQVTHLREVNRSFVAVALTGAAVVVGGGVLGALTSGSSAQALRVEARARRLMRWWGAMLVLVVVAICVWQFGSFGSPQQEGELPGVVWVPSPMPASVSVPESGYSEAPPGTTSPTTSSGFPLVEPSPPPASLSPSLSTSPSTSPSPPSDEDDTPRWVVVTE